jgi:hypothetical protein
MGTTVRRNDSVVWRKSDQQSRWPDPIPTLDSMTDPEILAHIHTLMDEEHELSQANVGGGGSAEVAKALGTLDIEIDRYWDLLRQRRALRRAGHDPETAQLRPPGAVEGYQQ